ncbi:MAG: putative endonuclease protein [Betaproteobacteria bacterium]|jgi:phosphatidylserine/phosphatidylglycerophosphate/cardiolipin synthase-like enzyme|nr:putative endonuclease protein [Betaproteobacteria bacterium]
MLTRSIIAALLCVAAGTANALQPPRPAAPFAASGTLQYAFTGDDHADEMIINAIDAAQRQVLMQAYSLTHRRIVDALIRARSRGVEVAVIIDQGQSNVNYAMPRELVRAGVPLLSDSQHAAAHNKVIVIDSGAADCAVVTGSFNFTYAAQHRNAENALILRGNAPLCEAYFNNWRRHQLHSQPLARPR